MAYLSEPFRASEIVGWFRRHHPEAKGSRSGRTSRSRPRTRPLSRVACSRSGGRSSRGSSTACTAVTTAIPSPYTRSPIARPAPSRCKAMKLTALVRLVDRPGQLLQKAAQAAVRHHPERFSDAVVAVFDWLVRADAAQADRVSFTQTDCPDHRRPRRRASSAAAPHTHKGRAASPAVRRLLPRSAWQAAFRRCHRTAGGAVASAVPDHRSRPRCVADAWRRDGRSRWLRR